MAPKMLFFDAGPIITIIMSRMASILPPLKKKFGGKFYITPAVRMELIDRPLSTRRFQFEALQVLKFLNEGILELYDKVPQKEAENLISLANQSFSIKGKAMDVIQSGEIESITCALKNNAAVVVDERTLRLFVEKPDSMETLLENRFQQPVQSNHQTIEEFSKQLNSVPIIRSIELVAIAIKMGLLDSYIPAEKGGKSILVEAALWTAKYNGCAVTDHEVEELRNLLVKK